MVLLLDNVDSFVHNVARFIRLAGRPTQVIRSDQLTAEDCQQLVPDAIVISPGPHGPFEAGCCLDVVRRFRGVIPILGICLGHQTIAAAYGAHVIVGEPMHGMASRIEHDGTSVFADLPSRFDVGRYHSLCVDSATMPPSLCVTAHTDNGVVMGLADHARCVHGVQFHPESMLTHYGQQMINRFFALADRHHQRHRRVAEGSSDGQCPVAWVPERTTTDDKSCASVGLIPPTLSIAGR
ncbi:MAG: aminodeoxychorismate/anthranilate synthase component II [Planctomycetota bacterium]